MSNDLTPSQGQFILFHSKDGTTKVECLFDADTLPTFFSEQELSEEAVVRLYRTTAKSSQLGCEA